MHSVSILKDAKFIFRNDMSRQLMITLVICFLIITVELAASFCSPLLPLIRTDFSVDTALVQMTMSFYLLGLGASAIVYGPLSDMVGRRPLLLTGLVIFCCASWACSWAPSIYWLIGLRLIQGVGAGAAWTVGNGVVKDVTSSQEYTKIMTVIHIVVGFVPALAPILGSYLGAFFGWRQSFLSLFAFSCFTLIVVAYNLGESLPQKSKVSVKRLFSGYISLLQSPILCRYMIVKVLMVMLLFVDAANLSLIFVENLHVPIQHFGFYVAMGFIGYLIGGWACHRLVDHFGNDRLLVWGMGCILASNVLVLALGFCSVESALIIQLCRVPIYFGWGLLFGNATACIVAPFAEKAGAASAMMIGLEMVFSFLGVYIMSVIYDGTVVPFACFMIVTTLIVYSGFYGLKRHRIAAVLNAS